MIKYYNFISYIIFGVILFLSGSFHILKDSSLYVFFYLFLVIFCSLLGFNSVFNIKNKLSYVLFYVLFFASTLSYFINFENTAVISYLRFYSILYVSLIISEKVKFKHFAKIYVNFFYFLAIFSLIIKLTTTFYTDFSTFFPQFTSERGVVFIDYFFASLHEHNIARINGFFWEPGINVSFNSIALLINSIYFSKGLTDKKNIFFILILLFSGSFAGYILFIIFYLIRSNIYSNTRQLVNIFIFIFLIFFIANFEIFINFLVSINEEIFSKLYNESISLNTRINSPYIDFLIFSENPFFGTGISQYYANFELYKLDDFILESQTSTLTYFIASTGFMGFALILTLLYKTFQLSKLNSFASFWFILFIFFILSKEPHQNFLLTFILLNYFVNINIKSINLYVIRKSIV